jgi:DNA-binding XRE family transcriptional regulator
MARHPSDIIATKRKALGLKQAEAAKLAGIASETWEVIERGVIQNPTLDTAKGIAKALGCKLADVWEWAK